MLPVAPLYEAQRRLLALLIAAHLRRLRASWEARLVALGRRMILGSRERASVPAHLLLVMLLREELLGIVTAFAGDALVAGKRLQIRSLVEMDALLSALELPPPTKAVRTSALARGEETLRTTALVGWAQFSARILPSLETRVLLGGDAKPVADVVRGVVAAVGRELWQAERIDRTLLTAAFNLPRRAVLDHLDSAWMRWTERVDDFSGRPKDESVGDDSLVLHGQVVPPGGFFTMPPDESVWQGFHWRRWFQPPNRPNCRAILVPWTPISGVPAWVWTGGRRVPLGN